jgi:hypothetical protein
VQERGPTEASDLQFSAAMAEYIGLLVVALVLSACFLLGYLTGEAKDYLDDCKGRSKGDLDPP